MEMLIYSKLGCEKFQRIYNQIEFYTVLKEFHNDQTRFDSGMQGWLNILKSIHLPQHTAPIKETSGRD